MENLGNIGGVTGAALAVVVLAAILERITEEVLGAWLSGRAIKLVVMALGLGIALVGKVNILPELGITNLHSLVGYIVTGLVIGSGSNIAHAILSKKLPESNTNRLTEK